MRKRVSVKGKGADIFFGDYTQPETGQERPDEAPLPAPGEETSPQNASMQASTLASMQEGKKPRGSPSTRSATPKTASEASGLSLPSLLPFVSERATVTNAFRYTERELSWLTDAIYEVFKRYRAKISKQEVARLGLAAVLLDFQERGDASLLAQLAARKKESGD